MSRRSDASRASHYIGRSAVRGTRASFDCPTTDD